MAFDSPLSPPDVSRGPLLISTVWTLQAVSAIIVILRLYSQTKIVRKAGLSEVLLVLALVTSHPGCSL